MDPKISTKQELFNSYSEAEIDERWYLFEESFNRALNKRDKEVIDFLKYHFGLSISQDLIDELIEKLK